MRKPIKLKKWTAHVAVLSANLIFGINFSAVQYITRQWVPPFGLNVIRVGVSSMLLWMLLLFAPKGTSNRIKKEHFLRFLLCAVTGVVINQLLFVKGLSMTLSIHASLLILVTPIFITLFAAWLGKEVLGFVRISGLFIGIGGSVMLVLDRTGTQHGNNIFWGDMLVIINAISYAFYFVLVKPLMKAYNPVQILRWIFSIGFFFMLPVGWNELQSVAWNLFGLNEFLVLTFIVVFSTFLAYLFNIYGIQRLGASITGTYIYTQPVFAAIIAVLFLDEKLTWYKTVSAILIACGVWMASREKRNNIKPQTAVG